MILSWGLYMSMESWTVQAVVQEAKERYPLGKPRLITDNGSQFLSGDFKELMMLLEMRHTLIRPGHPQSNGKLERFHRTLKSEEVRRSAYFDYEDARRRLAGWIEYYNEVRLHRALNYLTPKEVFEGKREERLAERREKLHTAYINRRVFWKNSEACSSLISGPQKVQVQRKQYKTCCANIWLLSKQGKKRTFTVLTCSPANVNTWEQILSAPMRPF
jgi:hypothetical protein